MTPDIALYSISELLDTTTYLLGFFAYQRGILPAQVELQQERDLTGASFRRECHVSNLPFPQS
eukprot:4323704-Amphidinium_carterae.1